MIYGAQKDFEEYLTKLAKAIEVEYSENEAIKEIVIKERDLDEVKGVLLTMDIVDVEEKLIIEFDMYDINDEPDISSSMELHCLCGDMHYRTEATRDGEMYEYDEETGEQIKCAKAGIVDETNLKYPIFKFIEDVIFEKC